jgi:hypothetical protein
LKETVNMFLNFLSVLTRGESKSAKQLYCKGVREI